MPVFISYSHKDKDFVVNLASQLVLHRARVWIDRWELKVGDSLTNKIQEAIQGASALVVILSKQSLASAWCNRELTAGLVRELEERRVVVLPCVIEDCEIPLFLRDKLYANSRVNFDDGLRTLLEAISSSTNPDQGRAIHPDYHFDWGIDWGQIQNELYIRVVCVEQAVGEPFTVFTEILIQPNKKAAARYMQFDNLGFGSFARLTLMQLLKEYSIRTSPSLYLEDQHPKKKCVEADAANGFAYSLTVTSRRLGEDTGKDLIVDISGQILQIEQHYRNCVPPLSKDEQAKLHDLV
jgi:hypothetical protein